MVRENDDGQLGQEGKERESMGISTKHVTIKGAGGERGGLRIVARLKRGSLFRLLSFMPVRRAPHASCAFDVHTCNTGVHTRPPIHYTQTPSSYVYTQAFDISRPSAVKSNSIWQRGL